MNTERMQQSVKIVNNALFATMSSRDFHQGLEPDEMEAAGMTALLCGAIRLYVCHRYPGLTFNNLEIFKSVYSHLKKEIDELVTRTN
jgi:hypothetical protein